VAPAAERALSRSELESLLAPLAGGGRMAVGAVDGARSAAATATSGRGRDMGAWGSDTFENDAACEWVLELELAGLQHVVETLDAIRAVGGDELEADLGSEGLAACDTIARLRGKPGQQDAYTEGLDAWVRSQTKRPPPELVAKALQVVDRIAGKRSELAELWEESDDLAEWRACVASLRDRLSG